MCEAGPGFITNVVILPQKAKAQSMHSRMVQKFKVQLKHVVVKNEVNMFLICIINSFLILKGLLLLLLFNVLQLSSLRTDISCAPLTQYPLNACLVATNFIPSRVSRGLNWKLAARLAEVSGAPPLWAESPGHFVARKSTIFGFMHH